MIIIPLISLILHFHYSLRFPENNQELHYRKQIPVKTKKKKKQKIPVTPEDDTRLAPEELLSSLLSSSEISTSQSTEDELSAAAISTTKSTETGDSSEAAITSCG